MIQFWSVLWKYWVLLPKLSQSSVRWAEPVNLNLAIKPHLQNKLELWWDCAPALSCGFNVDGVQAMKKKLTLLRSPRRNSVCENHVGKLEVFRWEEKGCEWSESQPDSSLRSRWFHSSLLPPGMCPPAALHRVLQADTLRGGEVLWKVIVWVRSWKMSHSAREGHFSGWRIRAVLASPVHASSAAGMRGSDSFVQVNESLCNADPEPCNEAIQLQRLALYSVDDIPRKQSSKAVSFPPFKAIQISSALETRKILSLPFFMGGSTSSTETELQRVYICEMVVLSFHLGASCLAECVENITPLWPKNEALGELMHPTVKNEQWKQWSCQFSYQDANKYPGCQAGGSAGPLVQHKDILQGRGMTADPSPERSYSLIKASSERAMIHIFKPRYLVSGMVNVWT